VVGEVSTGFQVAEPLDQGGSFQAIGRGGGLHHSFVCLEKRWM